MGIVAKRSKKNSGSLRASIIPTQIKVAIEVGLIQSDQMGLQQVGKDELLTNESIMKTKQCLQKKSWAATNHQELVPVLSNSSLQVDIVHRKGS